MNIANSTERTFGEKCWTTDRLRLRLFCHTLLIVMGINKKWKQHWLELCCIRNLPGK